ncbi:MAG: response regulator transcription factor [Sulfurimonas sp.]
MSQEQEGYSILYVEDNERVLENYAEFLKRFFLNVYTAKTAEEAWELYDEKKPEVLLIDIDLPGESGLDFLKRVREYDHNTRAIMLTGMSDVETLLNASELKLTKYLVKPILRDELKEAVNIAKEELVNFTVKPNKILYVKDDCFWDYDNEELLWKNKKIALTRKERELLRLLFSNVNKVFNSEDIIYELWYDYDDLKIASLKTLVKTLRKKIPEGMIRNVFGVGYKIES